MKRVEIGTALLGHIRRLYREAYLNLRGLDLGGGQILIVLAILDEPGLCQDDVCEAIHIDKSTLAKAMLKLIEKGYVKRERSKKDRRVWQLHPTKRAKKAEPALRAIVAARVKGLLHDLSKKEGARLLSLLERLA